MQQEQILSNIHNGSIKGHFSSRSRNGGQKLESKLIKVKRYIIRWHISSMGAVGSQTGQQEQILSTMYKCSIKETFRSRSRNGWQELENKLIKVKRYITRYHKSSIGAIVSQTRQQEQILSTIHNNSIVTNLSCIYAFVCPVCA